MKKILFAFALIYSFNAASQSVIPIVDFNNFFQSFENGYFRQLTFQPVRGAVAGDNQVAYYDYRSNLMVYNGKETKQIANMDCEYRVSDFLVSWRIASTLNLWDNGKLKTLTYQVGRYRVSDSLVVFTDTRYNNVNVYYNGEIYTLYASAGDLQFPTFVGENIVAFKDNGDFNKIFWRGQIYDLDVWHNPYHFEGGTDMIAFNDPINGTFAVFEDGRFLDVELMHVQSYKVGYGFVVYEDQNGELKLYQNGNIIPLSNFRASFYKVRDNVVVWAENGFTYAYVNGQKQELARYIPEDLELKNNVVAYRNILGGVSALIDGKTYEITNQMESSYSIHGSSVLVELFNRSYIVLWKGKQFTL